MIEGSIKSTQVTVRFSFLVGSLAQKRQSRMQRFERNKHASLFVWNVTGVEIFLVNAKLKKNFFFFRADILENQASA